jgi:hypothetical protein
MSPQHPVVWLTSDPPVRCFQSSMVGGRDRLGRIQRMSLSPKGLMDRRKAAAPVSRDTDFPTTLVSALTESGFDHTGIRQQLASEHASVEIWTMPAEAAQKGGARIARRTTRLLAYTLSGFFGRCAGRRFARSAASSFCAARAAFTRARSTEDFP